VPNIRLVNWSSVACSRGTDVVSSSHQPAGEGLYGCVPDVFVGVGTGALAQERTDVGVVVTAGG
jgi:hypothetical protein